MKTQRKKRAIEDRDWEFFDGDGCRWMANSVLNDDGDRFEYWIYCDDKGQFDTHDSDEELGLESKKFPTLQAAKDYCDGHETDIRIDLERAREESGAEPLAIAGFPGERIAAEI